MDVLGAGLKTSYVPSTIPRYNFCGPYWSDGKFQPSVSSPKQAPLNIFDATCRDHDVSLANAVTQEDVLEADTRFYQQNYNKGFTRSTAAVLVKYLNPIMSNKNPKLRGTAKPARAAKNSKPSKSNTSRADVPASYGFTVRATPAKVVRSATGAHISGSDFAGSVYTTNTNDYEPAASVPLNPAFFKSAMLGNLSRVYEKYRFKSATLEYIPSVPTSTQGQLVILSDRSIKNPFLDGSSSAFLGRALSQDNAVACPLWQRTTFDVACGSEWHVVDPLIDGDLDDSIAQELQCYAFAATTLTSGILILHYQIEFKDPLYTFHSTVMPVPLGIGSYGTLQDDTAVNATSDAVRLTNSTLNFSLGLGSIYRMVFVRAASTKPTGPATWADVASVRTSASASLSTETVNATAITMCPGTTVYGVLEGATVILYSSYDTAVAGSTNGLLTYATATTAVGTWAFQTAAVRLGNSYFVTSQ